MVQLFYWRLKKQAVKRGANNHGFTALLRQIFLNQGWIHRNILIFMKHFNLDKILWPTTASIHCA